LFFTVAARTFAVKASDFCAGLTGAFEACWLDALVSEATQMIGATPDAEAAGCNSADDGAGCAATGATLTTAALAADNGDEWSDLEEDAGNGPRDMAFSTTTPKPTTSRSPPIAAKLCPRDAPIADLNPENDRFEDVTAATVSMGTR